MLKLNLYFADDDYDKIYSKSQLLPIIIGYHIAQYVKRPNTTLTHAIEDMLHINLASYHTENRSKLNLIPRESYLKAARIALLAYVQFVKGVDNIDIEFDITNFKLKLVREEIDYKSTFNINDFNEHFQMMAAWYIDVEDLTDFVNHPNEILRSVIASRGYDPHLEVLVHDENEYVRLEVARHGRDKDLDILVHDPSAEVRVTVAEQKRGKDLDILVHDNDHRVRMTVVEQNRPQDLDILVNDSSNYVRKEVAKIGRDKDLDILVHDEDLYVRAIVVDKGRHKDLDILVNDSSHYVRKKVARHGRPQDLEILIHDEDPYVREVAIAMFEKLKTERIN